MVDNPYRPPKSEATSAPRVDERGAESTTRLARRFAIIGGAIGAFLPFCYGAATFYSASTQEVSPGTVKCGTPGLISLLFIVIGSPIGGLSFAVIGALLAGVCDLFRIPQNDS